MIAVSDFFLTSFCCAHGPVPVAAVIGLWINFRPLKKKNKWIRTDGAALPVVGNVGQFTEKNPLSAE